MDCFVILNADLVMVEQDQYVGNIALKGLEMMVLFVQNQKLMEEVQGMLFGIDQNVKDKIHKDVRRMDWCGILNVEKVFMPLVVVFVHQNVKMVRKILVFLVLKNHMEEVLENRWFVLVIKIKEELYVTINVELVIMELGQFVGVNVLLVYKNVVWCVLRIKMNVLQK